MSNDQEKVTENRSISLTWKLVAWILGTCGLIYLGTLLYAHALSEEMIIAGAEREADNARDAWIAEVEKVLRSIEESTQLLGEVLGDLEPSEDELDRVLRAFVAGNPRIYGSTAAFEPFGFRPSLERFSPYCHREGEDIVYADLADDSYSYWEWEWYTQAAKSGEPGWSEPYIDEGGGQIQMVTYSVPFFRETHGERKLRGVVTADLSLKWLTDLVRSIRIGRTGYGVILSGKGEVIAHSNERIRQRRRASGADVEPEVEEIVRHMLEGESAFRTFDDRALGKTTRLTYAPLEMAGWSLVIVYPEDELMEEVNDLFARQIVLLLLGLVVLVAVVVLLSRRLTQPIKALASSAGRIASGDLDTVLPAAHSRDEIGTLTRAFHHMRDSLKNYIRDLQITTAAKERLESELAIARKIQMDMLPEGDIGGDGFELSARLVPARAVGGDLYYHLRADGRLYFLVGDVSGKGVPAALFMARTKTLFETISVRESDVGAALAEVNRNLCKENEAGMFVTVIAGVLDTSTGELAFASGGHDPPARIPDREGKPRFVEIDGGPVLGLLEGLDFPTNRLTLSPGDAVVLYSDGVPEALNEDEDFFTGERLLEVLSRLGPAGASQTSDRVMTAVREFAGKAQQSDDITVMTLRYIPSKDGAGA
jgi:sigma-B regulation protein RsbU (phosphoserine phosphatase)